MKTSNVLASVLFGSLAAAAPFVKRDLVTKTEVVVETLVIYTTVWDSDVPMAEATSTPGLFYEQPSKPASSKAEPTPTPAYTPPVEEPSSVYTPPSSAPAPVTSAAPAPEPSSVYTPAPEPSSVYTPAPEPSSVYTPAPASSAPAPVQTSSSSTGEKYHGDITIYDNTGAAGACGEPLTDSDMIVALAKPTWGESTYDVMTGEATNPWCGQKITIEYQGNQIQATIMDLCPVCAAGDIDLSLAAWKALTGLDEKTRLQADWWKS
jgi:hypothetical protein